MYCPHLCRPMAATEALISILCRVCTNACMPVRCGVFAVYCSVLQCLAVHCSVLQCSAVCRSVLQCIAVCRSVLQCIAVYCSVLPSPVQASGGDRGFDFCLHEETLKITLNLFDSRQQIHRPIRATFYFGHDRAQRSTQP